MIRTRGLTLIVNLNLLYPTSIVHYITHLGGDIKRIIPEVVHWACWLGLRSKDNRQSRPVDAHVAVTPIDEFNGHLTVTPIDEFNGHLAVTPIDEFNGLCI